MGERLKVKLMIHDEPDARALAAILAMNGYEVSVEREGSDYEGSYRRYEVTVRVADHAVRG